MPASTTTFAKATRPTHFVEGRTLCSAVQRRQGLFIKPFVDVFFRLGDGRLHQARGLAQLDDGADAFQIDAAARGVAETRADRFFILFLSAGSVVFVLREQ